MLHQVNKPDCLAEMKKILKYQRRFLKLCLDAPHYPLDEVVCREWFDSSAIGKWTWERIVWQGKVTTFGDSVFSLMSHVAVNSQDTRDVFLKICHDQQFFVKRNNTDFAFQYSTIDKAWRDKLEPFLNGFYALLSREKGYPADIFGFNKDMSRKAFIDAQYEVNPPICPYCDAAAGDRSERLDANEAEHWLPKSIYPHLSIHWANLFRSCKPCNQTYKQNKNPIQHCGARELEKTYHPYDKFALDTAAMSARVNPKNPRLYQLEIEDVTNPICADELERLLVLSERWSNRMKDSLERDKSALVAGRVHEVIDEGGEISEDTVRSKLSAMAKSREREKGKRANALLEKAVLDFQVDHEVNEIFSTLEQIDGFRRY